MHRPLRCCTLALALAAPALAQPSGPPIRLVGYASGAASGPGSLQRQELCDPEVTVCAAGLPAAREVAGGAAYDPRTHALWHTDGAVIARTGLVRCALECTFPATRSLGAGAVASGLALRTASATLLQLETVAGTAALHAFDTAACPPAPITTCRITLPSGRHHAGAAAVSEREGVGFVATSIFDPQVANPANTVLVLRLGAACTEVCRIAVANCGRFSLGPIRALAVDDCRRVLLVSDGIQIAVLDLSGDPCAPRPIACCSANAAGKTWHGFDVEARLPEPIGRPCSDGGCASCAQMRLLADGAPAIGNREFGVAIDGPPSGHGFVLLNFGRCIRQTVTGLCGPVLPALGPPPIGLATTPLVGSACQGRGALSLPIPGDFRLCGGALCLQGVVLCSSGGVALTNGLQVILGD